MASLPSRWYRTLYDKSDISDFFDHINKLRILPIKQREFPGQIKITGEAYYLIRVVYKKMERNALEKLVGFFLGTVDVYKETAKSLGKIFYDYISNSSYSDNQKIELIHSFYLLMTDDDGSSATLTYCDAFSLDNPYYEPPEQY